MSPAKEERTTTRRRRKVEPGDDWQQDESAESAEDDARADEDAELALDEDNLDLEDADVVPVRIARGPDGVAQAHPHRRRR